MACCSQCPCCKRHTDHVQSLHQRALDELNIYCKLLQLGPLTSMVAFESSAEHTNVETALCLESITRSAALEAMPPEILDRIVQFVGADWILPLCHSIPCYKYISTAMFDFAHRFPNEDYILDELWPNVFLPSRQNSELELTDFQIQHIHAVGVYSGIISKHGGTVIVPCSKNILNSLGTFPGVLSVYPGDNHSSSGWAELLCALADANKRILSCTVDAVSGFSGTWAKVACQLTRMQIESLI
ncbi:hypothetical protein BJ741DRAFT_127318 [Chytriomyces cf. hyalinus JEL632]|nr:hypothetical protein BJ741DRAFT_127318 [Chytriomyces cf. hyalinus JEL632]